MAQGTRACRFRRTRTSRKIPCTQALPLLCVVRRGKSAVEPFSMSSRGATRIDVRAVDGRNLNPTNQTQMYFEGYGW